MVTYNQEKNQAIKTGQYMTEMMYKYLSNWTRPNNESIRESKFKPRSPDPFLQSSLHRLCSPVSASGEISP